MCALFYARCGNGSWVRRPLDQLCLIVLPRSPSTVVPQAKNLGQHPSFPVVVKSRVSSGLRMYILQHVVQACFIFRSLSSSLANTYGTFHLCAWLQSHIANRCSRICISVPQYCDPESGNPTGALGGLDHSSKLSQLSGLPARCTIGGLLFSPSLVAKICLVILYLDFSMFCLVAPGCSYRAGRSCRFRC